MLRRTWLRLALLCTALSGAVFIGFGVYTCELTSSQYIKQRENAFFTATSTVIQKLSADRSVTREWLAQTELNNNIFLYIFDGGKPLNYNESVAQGPKRTSLYEAAKLGSPIDIDISPRIGLSDAQAYSFEHEGSTYRANAFISAEAPPWYAFLAVQNKTAEQHYLKQLQTNYILIYSGGVTALFAVSVLFSFLALKPALRAAKKQSEFIAATSHELKSPLAVIRASASALLINPKATAAMARNIDSEAARLGALIEDLQILSSADAHTWKMHFTPLQLDTLVLNICESLEPLCKKTGHFLRADIAPGSLPQINADKARIEQILTILINNAISYAPKSEITVGVRPRGKGAELYVADKGPGIPDSEKKLIFDRFYRADKSRSDKTHFGLGLAVAKELTRLHKGTLTVHDAVCGGACFVLTLN